VRWGFGVIAVAFGCLVYAYVTLPDVRSLATTNPSRTAFMTLREQEAHAKGVPSKRDQRWVPYSRMSPSLKRAVLTAEDAAFWKHDGVDYVELQKSIEINWASGQFVRGGSTITQQLAKNLYLSPSKNPLRKLRELIIARRLEAALTKTRIFEIYLNVIEWGDGIYGIEAASRAYFHVSAASLNATQSALLAGAIVNPRLLNPAHPTQRLRRRQQIILSRMGSVSLREPRALPVEPSVEVPDVMLADVPPALPSTSEPEEPLTGPTDALDHEPLSTAPTRR
jgi:monofunctional biosynthetic peptidoglycan transglycosylase